MRPTEKALALAAALAATSCARATQTAGAQEMMRHNPHLLVSAAWLRDHLDSGVVVVHVGRSDAAYLAGHIRGARYLALERVAATINGVPAEFPPVERMAAAFSAMVIRPTDRIVIYGDDPGLYAARAWAALDMMGHGDRAALLDGGLAAWRAAGGAVDTGPIMLIMMYIPFVPQPTERLVDAAWVRRHLADPAVRLVDARPPDQFGGAEPGCPDTDPACAQIPEARRGHLPGARNVGWMNALVSREQPLLKPMHALHHEIWGAAGVDAAPVRTVVVYCRSGLMASHAYWQARYIGYADVRLYDGGFIEWAALDAATHPVER